MTGSLRATIVCLVGTASIGVGHSQEPIALDKYTCEQFLVDSTNRTDGAKLLKSLMMISWATGYASAYQKELPRANSEAIDLIAGILGKECRKSPSKKAVEVIVETVNHFAQTEKQQIGPAHAISPIAVSRGSFNTYNNFDIFGGDLRKLGKTELEQCAAVCEADSNCNAYSYDKWDKFCFLKSSISSLTLDPASIVGIKASLKGPPLSDVAIRFDRRIDKAFRGPHPRKTKTKSLELCEQSCQQDQKCLGYTFFKTTKTCELLEEISTFSSDKNAASGAKTQNPL